MATATTCWRFAGAVLMITGLFVAACGAAATPVPAALPATASSTPLTAVPDTHTAAPAAPTGNSAAATPDSSGTASELVASSVPDNADPTLGQRLWQQKPCSGCHGASAGGSIGPRLAGTSLDFGDVLMRVRQGRGAMPAFGDGQVSDAELQHIHAWLQSLAP